MAAHLRAETSGRRLHRRSDVDGQYAYVLQRPRAARHPDRARWLPVHQRTDQPWWPLLRTSHARHRLLNEIPGVSSVRPRGALYCFPRLDPEVYPITDDQQFVIDLLRSKHLLVTHGTGFNWPEPDHFRLVTLPDTQTLEDAIGRIG